MIEISLPDGSKRQFENSLTLLEVAKSISQGLGKAAIAAKVDGVLVDTSHVLSKDAAVSIITAKDPEGLEVIRHSAAHLLAQAVKELFPKAQVTIGPVIENGFYYDFAYDEQFTPADLKQIEKKMAFLAKRNDIVSREVKSRGEAVDYFRSIGEEYKAEIIEGIPSDEPLSLYTQGEFTDLCRGPHVPSTNKLKAFKLTKLAGAYWRGDSNNAMLQRIYGTAWASKEDLKDYLNRLEEAEKRDHRKLARKLDLYHMQEEAPGMVFWHHNGWMVYNQVVQYIRSLISRNGYQEINTPQLVDMELWKKSGHQDKFGEEMFSIQSDTREYAVKPMNCPCHVQVFNQGLKSHRDLPLRLSEFGSCHRNEPSGTLHGLMRVRNFVQDDAHIFCTELQIQPEVSSFIDLLYGVYADFGFEHVEVKLSTRPEQRVGSDEDWDRAELALQQALDSKELSWELQPGEGAFYGPKIEFSLKDCIGRVWQCGTIQVDFSMPGRLDAHYIAEDGSKQVPVMLHRAILGSLERFIGILIEEHAGSFPAWLAPIQAVVMGITDRQHEYVEKLQKSLQNSGFRANSDLRNEKIGFKIREHTLQRVPYLLIVGDKEQNESTVAVRTRSGDDLGTMSLEGFIAGLSQEVSSRGRQPLEV